MRAGQGAAELAFGLYDEPVDHGIGRSRGGLSSKIHHLVDGRGRPLVVLVGPGQANDSPMFPVLLNHLRVDRVGPGRPRTTPDAVLGDKAYSARAHCTLLRSRGIKTVIPEPVTFSGKWRGLFSASWHGQVVRGMARSVGPAIEYPACHLNTQDWGVPVHVVEGVAAVLTLPLHG